MRWRSTTTARASERAAHSSAEVDWSRRITFGWRTLTTIFVVFLAFFVAYAIFWGRVDLLADTHLGPLLEPIIPSAAIAAAFLLASTAPGGLSASALGLTRPPWSRRKKVGIVALIATSIAVPALVGAVTAAEIEDVFGTFPHPQQATRQLVANATPAEFVWLFIAIAIVAPVLEEMLCRGALYGYLRVRFAMTALSRVGDGAEPLAAIISALVFGLIHGLGSSLGGAALPAILALVLSTTVSGFFFAMLYEKSGSLIPAIIAHGLTNTVGVLLVYAGVV